jgi:signal transduction histidine kinase
VIEAYEVRTQCDAVVATLGHELRQPVAAIMTAIDLMGRTSPAKAAESFAVVPRQTQQMARLVDAILDASRLVGGRLRLRRHLIDLRLVARASVETVRGDVDKKSQRLSVDLPDHAVWCFADPARLQQVIVNLLTNANRYTNEHGCIDFLLRDAADGIQLVVRDTGLGLDAGSRERLFQPFMQRAASSGHIHGLGLGLTISRTIVQGHGGSLEVESPGPGQGSTFTVRLPKVLEHTREVREAVVRTREETLDLVARARRLRTHLQSVHGLRRFGARWE